MTQANGRDTFAALYSGRISPEPYQFAAVDRILQLPRPRLLIADDVGLGKTIEAGICMLELLARGRANRILLIVPPGLIPQWQDEMLEKFGFRFTAIENAACLDRVQTTLSEGIKPWTFLNRVITSMEYVKKRDVIANALQPRWDLIIVDEAHYLAESGTPRNPYTTARARLGQALRDACHGLILLTATPHNGYGHSFRSLLEIVEPTDATLAGETETVRRRVSRSMIRRLKTQIHKTDNKGNPVSAFPPREPVSQIEVRQLTDDEMAVFRKVSSYCAKTAKAAAGTDDGELVSFAMQIIKKRMLSSRQALKCTVANRLESLKSRKKEEEAPTRAEVRELQGDLPLSETAHERIASRILRSAIPKETRRRNSEKRQLNEVAKLLKKVDDRPDPKIAALVHDLKDAVLAHPGEKAIIFTEYRDTLAAIREAFDKDAELANTYVELTGGLSSKQRQRRMGEFEKPAIRCMLATDAASEGLNLQFHCRRVYHVELPWNPNRMEQRNGRIDRHGQARNPIIKYFVYPDSPEDAVLNRLVKRIYEMQQDRVSTPDILGILSSARIEEAITGINAEDTVDEDEASLFKLIDEGREVFAREVQPLVEAGSVAYGKELDPQSLSADPVIGDDLDLETFVLARLQDKATPAAISGAYAVHVPLELRGPGVQERYPCVTMRRSVAVQYPSRDVEFITRLHPLFLAMRDYALRRLTASQSPSAPGARLAVRRHPSAESDPYAVFTFVGSDSSGTSRLLAIPVALRGEPLDIALGKLALHDSSIPGEVEWQDVAAAFESSFADLQAKAGEIAEAEIARIEQGKMEARKELVQVLREDAEKYCADRLAEIDQQEKEAKLAEDEKGQLLFKEYTVSGFKARRAAINTFHHRRLNDLESYERPAETVAPQPLGVLFVFPPE